MNITGLLADDCPTGTTCPRIYDTDADEILVQGPTVIDVDVLAALPKPLPKHESLIMMPRSVLYGATTLDLDALGEWIEQRHTTDLFRLEVRRSYAVDSDGDDVRRYLTGEGEPNAEAKAPWLHQLRVRVGLRLQRGGRRAGPRSRCRS